MMNSKYHLFPLLVCLFFLIAEPFLCFAQTSETEKIRTIKVGIFTGEGYAEQDAEGEWKGIDIEIIQNIAQTAGLRVSFVVVDSASEGFTFLEDNTIDMLADIAKNESREKKYLFSDHEQGNASSYLFVREDDDRWNYGEVNQIRSMTVAAERDNIAVSDLTSWCSQYHFSPTIKDYPNAESAHAAVTNGEADAFVEGDSSCDGFRSILSFMPSSYYFVFKKDNTALKTEIDDAMAQIYIQNPLYQTELLERYANLVSKKKVSFTKTEKEYVAAHPTLRIAVLKHDEPYFYGTETKPQGAIPEFYEQISDVTGLRFMYKVYATQREALNAIAAKEVDIIGMFSSGMSAAYAADLSITRKYTTVNTVMVTRNSVTTTERMKVAMKQRAITSVSHLLMEEMPGIIITPCNTATDCFTQFTARKVDAMILGMPSVTYLMNQTNAASYVITPLPALNLDLCAVTGRGNKTLISILNKGISSVSYTMSGIIANNTLPRNTIRTFIARIPPSAIIIFAAIMILLVLMLLFALITMTKSRETKLAAERIKATAEEVRIKAEVAEKNAEEKNMFFSNISHDMRTPLNAVLGFTHLARRQNISPEQKDDYLSKVELSGNLLLDLINDTLTISRISSGKLVLHQEPCSTSSLVTSIISPIQIVAEQKKIIVTTDVSAMPERIISADRLNVEKIFLNLLTNAVRYTPEGGHVWFTIAERAPVSAAPDAVQENMITYTITVRDNGIGMAPEYIPHLFEPFSQEKQTGYDSTGTGLGLSIVKQLVTIMGGTIQVQSEKGKGTTFIVQLSFTPSDKQEALPRDAHTKKEASLAGKKILLCEDNSLNCEIAESLLEEKGIITDTAENGSIAVQKFSGSGDGEYACILMDVRMPVMNGLDATARIRSLNRSDAKTVPIIAMTANASADDVRECLDAGMNGHVSKPISPEQLFKAIQTVI